jgi:predicted kinase
VAANIQSDGKTDDKVNVKVLDMDIATALAAANDFTLNAGILPQSAGQGKMPRLPISTPTPTQRVSKDRRRSLMNVDGKFKAPELPKNKQGRVENPDATGGALAGLSDLYLERQPGEKSDDYLKRFEDAGGVVFNGEPMNSSHSLWHHLEPDPDNTGKFKITEKRAELHRQIIAEKTKDVPVSKFRRFFMLGGGPAAGKSTIVDAGQGGLPAAGQAVVVNADDLKEKLPEFDRLRFSEDDGEFFNAAAFAHEESSMITKSLQEQAFENGQDVVLDGTGDGKYKKLKGKVQAAQASGYEVNAVYATVPTEVAWDRSKNRSLNHEEWRYVPEPILRGTHRDVSAIFQEILADDLFDSVELFSTDGPELIPIISKKKGKSAVEKSHDEWLKFLEKAYE